MHELLPKGLRDLFDRLHEPIDVSRYERESIKIARQAVLIANNSSQEEIQILRADYNNVLDLSKLNPGAVLKVTFRNLKNPNVYSNHWHVKGLQDGSKLIMFRINPGILPDYTPERDDRLRLGVGWGLEKLPNPNKLYFPVSEFKREVWYPDMGIFFDPAPAEKVSLVFGGIVSKPVEVKNRKEQAMTRIQLSRAH